MGYGMLHFRSSKKNLNAKISTAAELIGTSVYVTFNIQMVMFMEAQVYQIKKNIIFQYNQSTIRMANNRKDSCIGNSWNIHIRHFFCEGYNQQGINRG